MNASTAAPGELQPGRRLMSVDALRGFDMFWIMGGDLICRSLPKIHESKFMRRVSGQMEHCDWAGFHFYDLIFPLFVFLVGVSIPFSLPRLLERAEKPRLGRRVTLRVAVLILVFLYYASGVAVGINVRLEIIGVVAVLALTLIQLAERSNKALALERIFTRSAILFLLGIFYMGGVASGFKDVYFAGVLHRIAGAYLFAALIFALTPALSHPTGEDGYKRAMILMALISATLLIVYWALMKFVPVPGVGAPDLSAPGKNLARYIDGLYMPGKRFEGTLLSTMAAVANCLLGIFAGLLLKNPRFSDEAKSLWLMNGGVVALGAGLIWSMDFPIIKLLWTSTYVLVSCGISAILLGLFHQIIEVRKFRRWAQPFVWMGANAITIYIIANVVGFRKLAARFVGGDIARLLGRFDELVLALVTVTLAFLVVRFLYQRKIFLRL